MSQEDNFDLDFEFSEEDISLVAKVFYEESKLILQNLDELISTLEEQPGNAVLAQDLFRKIHTIKGSVGPVPGGQLLGSLAHEFETLLVKFKKTSAPISPSAFQLFRKSSKLIQILASNLRDKREILPEELSEVIETLGQYSQIQWDKESSSTGEALDSQNSEISQADVNSSPKSDDKLEISVADWDRIQDLLPLLTQMKEHTKLVLDKNSLDLILVQNFAQMTLDFAARFETVIHEMETVSCEEAWAGLHFLVKQTSRDVNKKVRLISQGLHIRISRNRAHKIYEALVHLIRNSIDHGFEPEEERILRGKDPIGTITLRVHQMKDETVIDFIDDGQGLDVEKIRTRAEIKGLLTPEKASQLSTKELQQLIFHSGFSTKEKVSTLSGRGVGMDVVKHTVEQLGGTIEISSLRNKGTLIRMKISSL